MLEVGGRQLAFLVDPVAPGFWQDGECDASVCSLFGVCSSVCVCGARLSRCCLPSVLPLEASWTPLGFYRGNEKLPTPTDTALCISHPAARAEAAPTTSEPRTTRSKLLARDTPPTRRGGRGWRGFGGRSGCCCINAGQSDLAYVGREYGAIGLQQASRSMALSCLGWLSEV